MEAIIRINMDNAAFKEGQGELSWILSETARKVREYNTWHKGDSLNIRDSNGNTVGKLTFK